MILSLIDDADIFLLKMLDRLSRIDDNCLLEFQLVWIHRNFSVVSSYELKLISLLRRNKCWAFDLFFRNFLDFSWGRLKSNRVNFAVGMNHEVGHFRSALNKFYLLIVDNGNRKLIPSHIYNNIKVLIVYGYALVCRRREECKLIDFECDHF